MLTNQATNYGGNSMFDSNYLLRRSGVGHFWRY